MLDRRSCVLRDGRSRGLLGMRIFLFAINNLPHPEERPEGARLEGRNIDSAAIHSRAPSSAKQVGEHEHFFSSLLVVLLEIDLSSCAESSGSRRRLQRIMQHL